MACPMCSGTDSAADCTAGRCRFQEEIEEAEAARSRDDIERDLRNGNWGVIPDLGLPDDEPDELLDYGGLNPREPE